MRDSVLTANAIWHQTTWRGEPAWCATLADVLAVVSVARARLIYFGAATGTQNLLNAPYPQVLPDAHHPWPNQGGHRFWLGPQKAWVWPPPAHWEYSAAVAVHTHDHVLSLQLPDPGSDYPAITREYAWTDDRLRCTARWQDHGRAFFGMHIVAVDLPFVSRARLTPTPDTPLGLVQVNLDGTARSGFLPHAAVTCEAAHAVVRGGEQVIKLGFTPQPLTVERPGGWRLSLHPGPHEGLVASTPDLNHLSQIWVGGPEHDLAELEQLTPYLRGDAAGCCASSVYLSAARSEQ